MQTSRCPMIVWLAAILVLVGIAPVVRGGDVYWTNTAASANFTAAGVWSPAVPGLGDNAIFTNNQNQTINLTSAQGTANAWFDGTAGGTANTATLSAGSYTWMITNQFLVSRNGLSGPSNTFVVSAGTLAVTNAAGTAQIVVNSTNGFLNLRGGTIVVDRYVWTNANHGPVSDAFSHGTLTTLNGVDLSMAGSSSSGPLLLGRGDATAGAPFTFNMQGGVNYTKDIRAGWQGNYPGKLNITGGSTVLTNTGVLQTGTHADSLITVNGATVVSLGLADGQMVVTNGGRFEARGGAGGSPLVTGNNTLYKWISSDFNFAAPQIRNGARTEGSGNFYSTAANSTLLVSDPGSVLVGGNYYGANAAVTGVGLIVSNGATASITGGLRMANNAGGKSYVTVDGASLFVTNAAGTAFLNRNNAGSSGHAFTIKNNGQATIDVLDDAGITIAFNSGTLAVKAATVANQNLTVGNGTAAATLKLLGGSHTFSQGLTIANNGTLTGTGTANLGGNTLTFASGSALAPGASPGTLTIANGTTDINGALTYHFELGNAVHDMLAANTLDLTGLSAGTLVVSSLVSWQTFLWDYSTNIPVFTFTSQSGFDANDWTVVNGGGMKVAGGHLFLQGNTIFLTGVSNVPEASTLLLLGFGGWLLVTVRKKS